MSEQAVEETVLEPMAAIQDEMLEGPHGATILFGPRGSVWYAVVQAGLPEASLDQTATAGTDHLSRAAAIVEGCEALISWCSDQKQTGGKKHKQAAEKVQEWALKLAKDTALEAAKAQDVDAATGTADDTIPAAVVQEIGLQTSATPEPGAVIAMRAGDELALTDLFEHPRNPRRYFAEGPLAELTESIRARGVRTHLQVTPRTEGGFWILAGARRSRAAKAAGLATVPCIVRFGLSEADILEILSFENGQREDPHPLEEAGGWKLYMDETGCGVSGIMAKAGVSQRQVYARLSLLNLTEEAQQALWAGEINAAIATVASALPSAEQSKVLKYCTDRKEWQGPATVRDVRRFISSEIHLELEGACFDLGDEHLVPAAGSCAACPRRTKNNPELLLVDEAEKAEMEKDLAEGVERPDADRCTNPACFETKVRAHLVQVKAQIAAKGQEALEVSGDHKKRKKGPLSRADYDEVTAGTKGAQVAIVMDGYSIGKVVHVKLKPPGPSADDKAKQAEAAERKAAEQKAKLAREVTIRRKILEAVRPKVAGLGREDLIALLRYAAGRDADADFLCDMLGIKFTKWQGHLALERALPTLKEADLFAIAIVLPVLEELSEWRAAQPAGNLLALAKRYKVDAAGIRADVEEAAKEAEGGTRKEVIAKLDTLNGEKGKAKPAAKKAPAVKPAPAKKAAKPALPKKVAAKKGGKK